MEKLERAFYDMKFDLDYSSKTANEFQAFFNAIMIARYPSDFVPTRTWGQVGDQKCDGYILSSGAFYQVYAPDELNAVAAIKKMRNDFAGALDRQHFSGQFAKRLFVIGLSATVQGIVLG